MVGETPVGVHAGGTVGGNQHHRSLERDDLAGGDERPSSRPPGTVQNNLRNIGVAMIDYVTASNSFPASGVWEQPTGSGGNPVPWATELTNPTNTYQKRDYTNPTNGNDKGMRYSWVRDMLPRLDRSDLYDLWDTSAAQGNGTYLDTVVTSAGKRPAMGTGTVAGLTETDIRVFVCPDDITAQPGRGNLSYVVNGGFSPRPDLWPSLAPVT
ncbi:MAG: DUF1559 domain-containing protein [Planctomycetota bacterium]